MRQNRYLHLQEEEPYVNDGGEQAGAEGDSVDPVRVSPF